MKDQQDHQDQQDPGRPRQPHEHIPPPATLAALELLGIDPADFQRTFPAVYQAEVEVGLQAVVAAAEAEAAAAAAKPDTPVVGAADDDDPADVLGPLTQDEQRDRDIWDICGDAEKPDRVVTGAEARRDKLPIAERLTTNRPRARSGRRGRPLKSLYETFPLRLKMWWALLARPAAVTAATWEMLRAVEVDGVPLTAAAAAAGVRAETAKKRVQRARRALANTDQATKPLDPKACP